MSQRLTAEEMLTLKTGAFGAVFLVSNADPGLLAMIKESFAASGAISGTSGLVKEALTTGPLPKLPNHSPMEVEAAVMPALRRAVEILRTKAPDEVASYRAAVLSAADQVARAHEGVDEAEAVVIARIRESMTEPA